MRLGRVRQAVERLQKEVGRWHRGCLEEDVCDPLTDHPSDDLLELYSLNRLTGPDLARVEEHLLVCEECRNRLAETDDFVTAVREGFRRLQELPLDVIHYTERGPIRLRVHKIASGEWLASYAGLGEARENRCAKVAEANDWVLEVFRRMFPGHKCGDRCG